MKKGVQNINAIICKFKLTLTKTTNLRKKEAWKKQKVVDRQKTEAIAKK